MEEGKDDVEGSETLDGRPDTRGALILDTVETGPREAFPDSNSKQLNLV